MELIFTDQYANILFLVNGLAILFYLGAKKKKRQRAMVFGNYKTLQKVAGKNFLKSSNVILITKILALTALIVGISDPVLVREMPSSGTDYVVAIGASSSMLSSDMEPTRLDAAKDISRQFVNEVSNDTRVGVVSFSGRIEQESGLEHDKVLVEREIESVEIGERAGNAIGDAIYTSAGMLLETDRSREVILITDGRNTAGSPLNESLSYATDHNVTVTVIGIGNQEEAEDEFGTIGGENATLATYPNLDEAALNRTAAETGGEFITVTDISQMETAFLDIEEREVRQDISMYFIFLALGLMLLEWVFGNTRYSILP